jgi:hypothetical protein
LFFHFHGNPIHLCLRTTYEYIRMEFRKTIAVS